MKKLLQILILTVVCTLTTYSISFAMDATLSWDSNPDADSYVIYYGLESGKYTNETAKILKPETTYKFTGLPETVHYFAIKAFNECGNSSDLSDEVSNGPLPGVVTSVILQTCKTYEAL